MPFYAATSWPDIDAYMYNYSEFATSYAQDKGGCMKWYVYKDTGSSYKMILDHNTTGVAVPYASFAYVDEDTGEGWSGGRVNYCADKYQNLEDQKNCFDVITTTLKRDTEEWEIEDIDLISAEEMAEILEIENWEVDSYEIYDISHNYEWLLDNGETGDNASCDEPSCFVDGYWTKTKDITYIDYEGDNGVSFWSWGISTTKTRFSLINDYHTEMNDNYGIRPVITVPKNYFK